MTTVTITPDDEGRALTAEDLRVGDEITLMGLTAKVDAGLIDHTFRAYLAMGGRITSITRELPEPELPTEAGYYEGIGGDLWALNENGVWYSGGFKPERYLSRVRPFAPFTLLSPRDATREAAITEVIDWIESQYSGGTAASHAMDHARRHFLPTKKAD